jgi:hypothetical protein
MKKLLYLSILFISAFAFNSCTKTEAQDINDSELEKPSSARYIIVSGFTMSQLQTAVRKRIPEYKPTGGPFMFHEGGVGTEHYGQALYK